jgi:hypothetical protein
MEGGLMSSKGEYLCPKCGETAFSKCGMQRTMFPSNQHATLISNKIILKSELLQEGETLTGRMAKEYKVTLEFYPVIVDGDLEDPEAALIGVVRSTDEATLKIALCNHEWQLTSETCEFGCCHRKEN